ncbi:unnamed protein product [Linum trigynum]|uniref:THIF-type NAD/FAD binding fold domain-containing protein n=1 Tax=Linum trigynum TaxID=586398 RepID=A0AAV2E7T9_9ROSI
MTLGSGNQQDIDEDLHSHQLAVYGRETMRRLFVSNVLISGMNGLDAENAKNLVLAGVTSVTLYDEGMVELWDLSSNFVFTEQDVGKNRALACIQNLQELNNSVVISTLTGPFKKEPLSDFQAIVFTDLSIDKAIVFDDYCHIHQPPITFSKSEVRGLFNSVFCGLFATRGGLSTTRGDSLSKQEAILIRLRPHQDHYSSKQNHY